MRASMRRTLIAAAAAALFASAGTAEAMTSGAMPANEPITANTTLHDGIRTNVPAASAQVSQHGGLILTTRQQHRIWNRLAGTRGARQPVNFEPTIGRALPPAVALHAFPRKLAGAIPPIAGMRYAKLAGQVLVVRRSGRKIEQVIRAPS